MTQASQRPRAAEFFAGIGLVRLALEQAGIEVVFANDISETKYRIYEENFPAEHFALCDVAQLAAVDIPDIEIATASFPCTDLSLAGNRAGIRGAESGTFWEFTRVLKEMDDRRPQVVLLENVGGLGSSAAGRDLREAILELNRLGYWCDIVALDAVHFVPQSRPRVFIVGSQRKTADGRFPVESALRPRWILEFARKNPDLDVQWQPLFLPISRDQVLSDVVEQLPSDDPRWWDVDRKGKFENSLSKLNHARLENLRKSTRKVWATAYRRTRGGVAVWEMRTDGISGCLRTARGGSSKQAVVEAGRGGFRVRWMTPREYARLQGAPEFQFSRVSQVQAMSGFGDAVCVPAVAWLASAYLKPLVCDESRSVVTYGGEQVRSASRSRPDTG